MTDTGTVRRTIGLVIAWTAATILAIAVAAAAVGSVRSEITDDPTPLGSANASALAQDAPGIDDVDAAHAEPEQDDPATPTVSTPADSGTVPTTTVVAEPGETPTTIVAPSTTTTTVGVSSYTKTFDTDAGSVRVVVSGEDVTFAGAFPNAGWTVELKDDGPEKVEVHFERNEDEDEDEDEIEFIAKVEHGELVVSIS